MPEILITTRSSHFPVPTISDREGPLGADTTFHGQLVIHLLQTDPMPSEGALLRALVSLRQRYPHRLALLDKWDALDDQIRLANYLKITGVLILHGQTRLA